MNVAALLSGPIVDYCTILFKNSKDEDDKKRLAEAFENGEAVEWSLTGYRLIVLLGIITNIIACFITTTVKEIKVCDPDRNVEDIVEESGTSNAVQEFRPENATNYQIIKETLQSSNFWRFLCVIIVTLNVRMIFRHLDATLPKYMVVSTSFSGSNIAFLIS